MERALEMRTKTLIACLAIGLFTLGQSAWAAGSHANAPSHTTSLESTYHPRQTHRLLPLSQHTVSGVIPRATGGGHPLQMLNPLAPPKYGTAQENVSLDPDIPGKGNGINFISISF
jgi:hypothetical protein